MPIPSGNAARRAAARRGRYRSRATGILAAGLALLALLGGSDWTLSQSLLRQALSPNPQSEAPQVQEEGAQQGTDVEAASTEETVQAEEATNVAPNVTDSSEQPPSTEITASPALAFTPVANTSNPSAEPVQWSGPAQQPSQPALEQQPTQEQQPALEQKPAEEKPAEVQAVASQVRSDGRSSNTQNGGRTQKQRFTEQISGSQKSPHK